MSKNVSRDEIELLLKTQQGAFRESINILIENFNDKIKTLESTVTNSLQEIRDLKKECQNKQVKIDDLVAKVEELEVSFEGSRIDIDPINNRIDYLDDQSRRNNLRIDGLSEFKKENWEQTQKLVENFIRDKIEIHNNPEIERAHRVGRFIANSQRPRTIVVKFMRFQDKQKLLMNSKKLKGSSIYFNEDLCEQSINKRKEQLPKLQAARRQGKIAYFQHTKLIIKDKRNLALETPETVDPGASSPGLVADITANFESLSEDGQKRKLRPRTTSN